MTNGKIFVFTGDGKGKTTAAIGMVVRALGRGKKVVIIQFMKGRESGEDIVLNSLRSLGYKVDIYKFGSKKFVDPKKVSLEDKELVRKGYIKSLEAIREKPFLLVVDEILVATFYGLLSISEVLDLIMKARANNVNLVLTGRWCSKEILEEADLATEMKNIKHYFDLGVKAEEGIEY